MDNKLYKIAVRYCSDSYQKNNRIDLGTTEFSLLTTHYHDELIQVLSIPGTDEFWDWLKNIDIRSIKGIKRPAYLAAFEIFNSIQFKKLRNTDLRLLVTGHSKGGATAIAFKKILGADWCVVFAPARSLRYWIDRKMKNTTIFRDPDDPVSELMAMISFGQPIAKTIKAKDDHFLWNPKDHSMDNWKKFINQGKI